MRASRFAAVYPKLHHGTATLPLDSAWVKAWHEAGFFVVGWGWLEADPVAEAQLAVGMCRSLDLDGYIGNAEVPYESANYWKSAAFVQEFRRLAPRAPLALSGIGYGYPVRELDYAAWRKAGAVFMPQCYPNWDGRSVYDCLWHADRAGWSRADVIPTLGTWQGNYGYSVETYVAQLRYAWTLGFNVFPLPGVPDAVLTQLGRSVEQDHTALILS